MVEWLEFIQTLVLVLGVSGGFVVYFLRDVPVRLLVRPKGRTHELLVLTKKGKLYRQSGGPFSPEQMEDADNNSFVHDWELMHSLPRKKGFWALLLNEFEVK